METIQLNTNSSFGISQKDKWIYYSNTNDDYKIYKVKTDGSQSEIISHEGGLVIKIQKDKLVYLSLLDGTVYEIDN